MPSILTKLTLFSSKSSSSELSFDPKLSSDEELLDENVLQTIRMLGTKSAIIVDQRRRFHQNRHHRARKSYKISVLGSTYSTGQHGKPSLSWRTEKDKKDVFSTSPFFSHHGRRRYIFILLQPLNR